MGNSQQSKINWDAAEKVHRDIQEEAERLTLAGHGCVGICERFPPILSWCKHDPCLQPLPLKTQIQFQKMDSILKKITKATDAWRSHRSAPLLMSAMEAALRDMKEMERKERRAKIEEEKKAAIQKWFEATKAILPALVKKGAAEVNDAEVARDWKIILTDVEGYLDYFCDALRGTLKPYVDSFVVKVEVDCEFGERPPCSGDDCWYAGNMDRVRGMSFYENLMTGEIYCDMCIHEHDHDDIPMEEVVDDFVAFLKKE